MDPNFGLAHNQLAQAHLQKQMYAEAIAELRKAIQLSGGSPTCTANLARAYAASGKRNEALQLLSDLKKSTIRDRWGRDTCVYRVCSVCETILAWRDAIAMADSYTKESLCAGMLEEARSVAKYMREKVRPRLDGVLSPTNREILATGIFLRSLCWMETLARLDRVQDFQAVSTGTRFLPEACVDLVLINHDNTEN